MAQEIVPLEGNGSAEANGADKGVAKAQRATPPTPERETKTATVVWEHSERESDIGYITLKRFDLGAAAKRNGGRHLLVGSDDRAVHALLVELITSRGHRWDVAAAFGFPAEWEEAIEEIVPRSCIYQAFDVQALARMVCEMRDATGRGDRPRALLLLGNGYMSSEIHLATPEMRELVAGALSVGIDLYMTARQVEMIPAYYRARLEFVFAVGKNAHRSGALIRKPDGSVVSSEEDSHSRRIDLWRRLFGTFETFREFEAVLDVCCASDDGVLALDNTLSPGGGVEETVSWHVIGNARDGKADIGYPAAVVSEDVWRLHHMFEIPYRRKSHGGWNWRCRPYPAWHPI